MMKIASSGLATFKIEYYWSVTLNFVQVMSLELYQPERHYVMSEKYSSKKSQTDWNKVDRLTDSEIDTSDTKSLDSEFFKHTKLRMPSPKKSITVRLDSDVLEWYRGRGKGYQTKINAILRTYMDAHSKQ